MYTTLPLRHALFAFVILFASVALFTPHVARSQSSSAPLTGYAWSENIGWVSFNCLTGGPTANNICATSNYAMNIASDGTLSGYAWSEHIGWISANAADLAGCPTAPCTAKMTGAALNGWFKALSADNKGWDGWINLSGSGYGPTLSSGGVLAGFAWGSDVVGWLQFDGGSAPVSTTWQPCTANYFCTGNAQYYQDGMCVSTFQQNCSYQCSAGVCIAPPAPAGTLAGGSALKVTPTLAKLNSPVAVVWGVSNVTSCTVTGTNNDGTAASTNATSPGVWNTTSGTKTSSPITKQTTYKLVCTDLAGTSSTIATVTVSLVPRWFEL